MYQLKDTTPPKVIPKTQFIATSGSILTPVSYRPVSSVDAWARHAYAANGFGDARIQPITSHTETSQ